MNMIGEILIYGRLDGSCLPCLQLKQYLDSLEIPYTFYDIGTSDIVARIQYKKELTAYGVKSIPFTILGQEKIVGFNKETLDRALGIC